MAIENFKPEVLEEALIESYREVSVADVITARPSRVEGKLARFNVLADGAIKDYEGNVEVDEIQTVAIDLLYDKKKYFAVGVDDADACMLAGDVLMPMANQLAHKLAKAVEAEVLAEAVKEGKAVAKSADIVEDIINAGVVLDEANVPEERRYVIMRPADVAKIAKDERVIAHHQARVLENGVVEGMEINGMRIIKSNACPEGNVIVLHADAIAKGELLEKTEAMRSEHAFEDVIRGLMVFGVKAIRKEAIAVIK